MEIQETIEFNGITYKLMGAGKYYLSQSNTNAGRKRAKGLHVAIWEHYNKCKVPKGYCIHHKDGNTFNNNISNLECISRNEHQRMHILERLKNEEYRKTNQINLSKGREKAAEWHKSEAGRKWHSKHSKEIDRTPRNLCVCKECGKTFYSSYRDTMFCCDGCGDKYRTKILQYDGICKRCGKPFKYGKPKKSAPDRLFCSRKCAVCYSNTNRAKKKE